MKAFDRLKLDGQVAIVTGAGRGVGRGIAEVLAEAGAAIVAAARSPEPIEELASQIRAGGGRAIAVAGDVMKRADNEKLVAKALEEFGRVDILINNAGTTFFTPFMQLTEDDFRTEFEWNTLSAFTLTQLVAPHMLERGSGCVVNISSASAHLVTRSLAPYTVSKAALEALTRCMAQELSPKIRVNAISLGTILTEGLANIYKDDPSLKERVQQRTPLHRVGEPQDVGLAALYLCSSNCYATGAIYQLDGGLTQSVIDQSPDL